MESCYNDETNALASHGRFFGLTRMQVLRGTTDEPTQQVLPFASRCHAIYDLQTRDNKLAPNNELCYYLHPSHTTPKAHVVLRASDGKIFTTGRLRFHPIIEIANMAKQQGSPTPNDATITEQTCSDTDLQNFSDPVEPRQHIIDLNSNPPTDLSPTVTNKENNRTFVPNGLIL